MEKHVNIVAYINIAFGALGILIGIGLLIFLPAVGGIADDPEAMGILTLVGGGLFIFFLTMSIPDLIGGIGLLKRKRWARILVIIFSILDLINLPFGTAIGIYSLWVLMNGETVELFAKAKQVENVKPAL